jgi:hypothetical protein
MALQQYQQNHIEAWQASSLSQAAYCREYKLNSKTFGNWLRIYRTEQMDFQVPAAMIPVNIKPAISSTSALYLHGSGGHTLQLPTDVSPQWLGELLKCLD